MNRGNFRGALDDFSNALKADPAYVLSLRNRALTKSKLHDFAGAIADYDRAVKLSPKNFRILAARAYTKEISGNYKGAVQDYTELIKIMPNYEPEYLIRRARAKEKAGDSAGAKSDMKRRKLLV